jgi:hypothetical protein
MNNTIIVALVCITLGFAAGWLVKPAATVSETDETTHRSTSRAKAGPNERSSSGIENPRSANRSTVTVERLGTDQELDPEMKKQIEESQRRHTEMVKKRLSDKFDMQITAIVKELELNASQEKALRAFYAEQVETVDLSEGMASLGNPEMMKEMAAALRGDGLNDAMKNVLSADQMEGLEAIQERKNNNKIESRAMKDLAKLQQSLDLSEDQKQKVYNVLMEDAEKKLAAQSDADYVTRAMMSSMGVEMDLGDMDMGSVMSLQAEGKTVPTDRASMIQKMKDDRQRRIDDKVARLAPVLDKTQQEQYRKSLENQGGMLNMMLQGMETDESEVEVK